MNKNNIYVTMPSLAPLEEFTALLKGVWERGILTHNGPLLQQLEHNLCRTLGVNNFIAVSNGTIAIQMAIKALELKGEIITSPFTWIATVSAIKWEGCIPVFCDIDPETLNIDVEKLEAKINKNTVAIMPVHVFGNPCDIERIDEIAKNYNLKVIYDGAHAIGSTYKNRSVLQFGDITATSLHATKLLNTAEGGGCITNCEHLAKKLQRIRFFGHDDSKDIIEDGFNGKLTEVHAALGLANLKYYQNVLQDRREKYFYYKSNLMELCFVNFQKHVFGEANYSYFPLIIDTEKRLLEVVNSLQQEGIYARRYFYPAVNTYDKVVRYEAMPLAENISKRILCLPLHYNLSIDSIDRIIKILKKIK